MALRWQQLNMSHVKSELFCNICPAVALRSTSHYVKIPIPVLWRDLRSGLSTRLKALKLKFTMTIQIKFLCSLFMFSQTFKCPATASPPRSVRDWSLISFLKKPDVLLPRHRPFAADTVHTFSKHDKHCMKRHHWKVLCRVSFFWGSNVKRLRKLWKQLNRFVSKNSRS